MYAVIIKRPDMVKTVNHHPIPYSFQCVGIYPTEKQAKEATDSYKDYYRTEIVEVSPIDFGRKAKHIRFSINPVIKKETEQ